MDLKDIDFKELSFDALVGLDSVTALTTAAYTSPVVAPVFDVKTVSPEQLLQHAFMMPTPSTGPQSSLESPTDSLNSPLFGDINTSPEFGGPGFDMPPYDYPLFPDTMLVEATGAPTQAPLSATPSDESSISPMEFSATSTLVDVASLPTLSRRKTINTGRHSVTAGVNARRREKPLPPIVIQDPSDVAAMKRARNTLAARKSRQRKAERLDELEQEIALLKEERDHWKRLALDAIKE